MRLVGYINIRWARSARTAWMGVVIGDKASQPLACFIDGVL